MLGDIFEGAVRFGASYIGGKKRLARREEAQAAYDTSMQDYFSQDTSNLYANLENTMEDLTVNQEAARFQMQQQAQGQANIMGGLSAAAGGSGIAALAQSLANQQAQSARAASIDIGRQEQANQMAAAGQAARLQMAERYGAEQSRALEAQLAGEQFMIDAGELQASEQAIQEARAARTEAIGQLAGGVGNAVGSAIGGVNIGGLINTKMANAAVQGAKSISTPEGQANLDFALSRFGKYGI